MSGENHCRRNLFWFFLGNLLFQLNGEAQNNTPECSYSTHEHKFSCFEVLPKPNQWSGEVYDAKILEIRGIKVKTFDLSDLRYFSNVTNVTIWQGNVSDLTGTFPETNIIEVLQLKNLSMEELGDCVMNSLHSLRLLDLRGNRFKKLEATMVEAVNRIKSTYLSKNQWDCSLNLEWVLKLNATSVKDMDNMTCYQQPYPGKPLVSIAQFKQDVQSNCPEHCDCSMPDVVRDPETLRLEPIIEVNCTDRGFTEFPSTLPARTKSLMLESNSISSLEPLISNPIYRGVQDLYLDNNLVDSVEELEGVYWLSHFRILSLSSNKLSQLPTYALDNALQQNPNMPIAVQIYLGNNPWRCDCVFTPGFQEMLRKYEMQVKDIDDIRCSYVDGDENSLTLILDVTRSSVCHLPSEYSVRILDLLNGVLASLIILILGKLGYDYYHFKRTGRLPWIVTKMP